MARRSVPLLAIIAVGIVLIVAAVACMNQDRADFERRCLARHPGAHVSQADHYGYKSYSRTLYCLGPNGELWEVE